MSEYQYVGFRAIDGPVSAENLNFMQEQSSRAEVTRWSFDNEYHFGDFHGNAEEMLRRGYDFHLHYANFGIRKLMIRLPDGLPDAKVAEAYFESEALVFVKDKKGSGGFLCIEPFHEPGNLKELWGLGNVLDRLLPLRGEILDGDLRPLYLAHLAVACDGEHNREETKDAPVAAGLDRLSDAQRALVEFFGLDESLLAAAAQGSPALPKGKDVMADYRAWLEHQPEATKTDWLIQLMANPDSPVRRDIVAEYQNSRSAVSWPTVRLDRTIADLQAAAEEIQRQEARRRAKEAERARAKRRADMAANPTPTLQQTEKLVNQRTSDAYRQIALLLTDLREALAECGQSDLAEKQARKLNAKYPTLRKLTSELRHQGFLKKESSKR